MYYITINSISSSPFFKIFKPMLKKETLSTTPRKICERFFFSLVYVQYKWNGVSLLSPNVIWTYCLKSCQTTWHWGLKTWDLRISGNVRESSDLSLGMAYFPVSAPKRNIWLIVLSANKLSINVALIWFCKLVSIFWEGLQLAPLQY